MTNKRDYYEVLGVAKNANNDDIKKAFRRLAMKYHPDRNPNDKSAEGKFKEAKEAYDILSNPEQRAKYDQFGHAGINYSASGFGGMNFNFDDVFGDIGDIFGDIFGGGRGRRRHTQHGYPGADLRYELGITLEEAVFGVTKKIKLSTLVTCSECGGSGAKKGSKPKTCSECQGVGHIRIQQGFFSIQQTCPKCHGQGRMVGDPCPKCRGQGRQHETKMLSVKIPAGINSGDRIRLAGEGEAGAQGGQAGDLYVEIHVSPHPIFNRRGNDLYCDVPIDFMTAALGGEITVPTFEGQIKLKIPAETQTGKTFRLRGKGVKSVRGGSRGDILCRVLIETPVKLDKQQKQSLEEFQELLEQNPSRQMPNKSKFLENIKNFLNRLKK